MCHTILEICFDALQVRQQGMAIDGKLLEGIHSVLLLQHSHVVCCLK